MYQEIFRLVKVKETTEGSSYTRKQLQQSNSNDVFTIFTILTITVGQRFAPHRK